MAMNPGRQVIDDEQLDEALRRIASAAAPGDLPARVLTAIHEDAPPAWLREWRPAVAALAVVVLLVMVGVWVNAPDTRREAQGSRHMAQGTGPMARGPDTSAHGSGRTVQGAPVEPDAPSAPQEAQGSRLMAHGSGTHPRTHAPLEALTRAHAVAEDDEIELLEPPEPLNVARLQMTELSERALQVDALHVPALEIASLER